MNTPIRSASTSRAHPILIAAGSAVVLVCLTATAALIGWLPTSTGANADHAASAQGATAIAVAPATPARQATVPAAPRHVAATPVIHRPPRSEPIPRAQTLACQNCGTVESIREVTIRGDGSGLGAAGGAVVGGLLGNQVGGGHGKQAMTVVGAIGGAFAGNQIEKQARATHSYETTVHMNNGATRTVAQATRPEWRNGDHVKIVDGVVRMNG